MAKKVVFEVDENCIGRIYINGEKLEDVASVEIKAEPFDYTIKVEQNKKDENGKHMIKGGKIVKTKKSFHFGKGD